MMSRKFITQRSSITSFSTRETVNSVNYDDVISAERLTEEVGEHKMIPMSNLSVNSLVQNRRQSAGNFRRRMSRDDLQDEEDEFYHRELILKIRKTLPLKNFRDEIRARRDLEKFLVQPVVVLDVPHTSLDKIVDELLSKLQKDLDVDEKITSQAGKSFFTFQETYQDAMASVDHLKETIQGVSYKPDGADYEETWITALCTLPMVNKSHVAIARLRNPLNLGNKCEEVQFVIAIIAPKKEKFTKNAVEIGRTFSSMMCNRGFRHSLMVAETEKQFKEALIVQSAKYKRQVTESLSEGAMLAGGGEVEFQSHRAQSYTLKQMGRGIYDDIKRRLPHYWSDYKDGFVGKHTIHKVIATILFLYFACLLPDIAFGTLYEKNTNGVIDVTSCIMSQTVGGLVFALISGQPMLVLLTTAPLALYVKVIKIVSTEFNLDFKAMYAMTGIWNGIFLLLQSVTNASMLMKYSTRSTEEIFGFFIALAFSADAIKATIGNFQKNYNFECPNKAIGSLSSVLNMTMNTSDPTTATPTVSSYPAECISKIFCCRPENSILFLFLMCGTLWLGLTLLRFDESQFLSSTKREILTDYALPLSVIIFSFFGSYVFRQIPLEGFNYIPGRSFFTLAPFTTLPPLAHVGACGLGLCLSCLFFVDQNVSAAVINSPQNKLVKGPAYHWDLMVVGFINIFLSIFNLPWVHAALPHSPMHVKALADVEQHVTNMGTVHDEIVKVRETRITSIVSHVLIGLSLLFVPVLQYVPIAVLQGLFLYLGFSSFSGNQMFDRMMLIFTEGSSYPPNHYVRKVPQRKLHLFTLIQVLGLVIVSVFGFVDLYYMKMIFPVIILLLLPIRHKLLPKIIERKYLAILDS
uniref:sodium bicarbonate transporter-like protein 11 isoform X2 n=1 Tax=Ciona intestinalis TaxID=7719 RepID=UPI000EF4B9C6|nr:sodium bicarbonate transporter-like protein 11 isoform X2 [Ciona intestinalis]|eukprot:XP_026692294.1 sodium bicarbonate transporter-like protein 11 isoform X2 [Ciona intestinalis]